MESRANKRSGGTLSAKVALLEVEVKKQAVEIAAMKETLEEFHDAFREFREEVRLTWAKEKAREDALREVRQEREREGS